MPQSLCTGAKSTRAATPQETQNNLVAGIGIDAFALAQVIPEDLHWLSPYSTPKSDRKIMFAQPNQTWRSSIICTKCTFSTRTGRGGSTLLPELVLVALAQSRTA